MSVSISVEIIRSDRISHHNKPNFYMAKGAAAAAAAVAAASAAAAPVDRERMGLRRWTRDEAALAAADVAAVDGKEAPMESAVPPPASSASAGISTAGALLKIYQTAFENAVNDLRAAVSRKDAPAIIGELEARCMPRLRRAGRGKAELVEAKAAGRDAATIARLEAKVVQTEAKVAQAKAEAALAEAKATGKDQATISRLESEAALAQAKAELAMAQASGADAATLGRLRDMVYARMDRLVSSPVVSAAAAAAASSLDASVLARGADAAKFARAVLGAGITDVTGVPGMKMMDLGDDAAVLVPNQPRVIVLRERTMKYWGEVSAIVCMEQPQNVVALGSPGTGKSATTPFLIRLLLEARRTVVYQVREKGASFFLIFRNDGSNYSHFERSLSLRLNFLQDPEVVLVVEPRGERFPPDIMQIKCRFVLVCSPNKEHYRGLHKGGDHGSATFLYHPLWTLEELLAARSLIPQNPGKGATGPPVYLSAEDVTERHRLFGGCVRNVFCAAEKVSKVLNDQELALPKMDARMFSYILDERDWRKVEIDEASGASSSIVGYECSAPFTVDSLRTVLLSQRVKEEMWYQHLVIVWSAFVTARLPMEAGVAFERYCLMLLTNKMTAHARPVPAFPSEDVLAPSDTELVAKARDKIVAKDVCANVRAASSRAQMSDLAVPSSPNFPLVDALDWDGSKFRGFQCTVSISHGADPSAILTLVDKLFGSGRRSRGGELHLYYLVPDCILNDFVTKPQYPLLGLHLPTGVTVKISFVAIPRPEPSRASLAASADLPTHAAASSTAVAGSASAASRRSIASPPVAKRARRTRGRR
jgi:hypothetical protein